MLINMQSLKVGLSSICPKSLDTSEAGLFHSEFTRVFFFRIYGFRNENSSNSNGSFDFNQIYAAECNLLPNKCEFVYLI